MLKRIFVILIYLLMSITCTISPVFAEGDQFQKIDHYVKKQMKEQSIVGLSYAIIKDDKIVHMNALGKADLGRAMKTSTPIRIGSLSKSFTALAIMQLVEKGSINLQAPVTQYIPSFQLKDKEKSDKITVQHLLNQVSGIPGMADMELGDQLKNKSLEETVKLLKIVETSHPAGEKFEYANFNYLSLGLIVEKVSGLSLEDYIDQYILKPLNMSQSFTSVKEAKRFGLSKGFSPWFGLHYPAKTFMDDLPNFLASGYMVSSVKDLGKYVLAFMNGSSLLSTDGMKKLQTPSSKAKMIMGGKYYGDYAMGWFSRNLDGINVIGHAGDLPSVGQSDMYIIPETKEAIVILSNTNNNYAPGSVHDITEGVIRLLADKEPASQATKKSFQQFYLIADGVIIGILLLIGGTFFRLRKFKRNFLPLNIWKFLWGVFQIVVPAMIYLALPKVLNLPKWSVVTAVQPDLITVLLISLFFIFAIGICKLQIIVSWILNRKIKVSKYS
ncbi:serine hydrolase domain-containing protein [Bacillus sp. CGMCC 1.16607]|uniref:serine hydrolase domain-containing protein n=1 Tax=Bacillus sp. CGMCC 1.16607 TaxID=3351842 RepID=UPI003625C278